MAGFKFFILDVFAEEKYAGNQLAVFLNAGGLSSIEMQKIAREINFSETTFILSEVPSQGGYHVRIFTPGKEVPFAGHPTLGTAKIIREKILGGKTNELMLNLKVGQTPVTFSEDGYVWMKQIQPEFGMQHSTEALAKVLGLETSELDSRFPIQEVSTGLPFFIVPLSNISSLKKAKIQKDRYFEMIQNTDAKGILIFCPETYETENDLSVRVFVDYYGVPEDPATGSANGCLAGYLVQHRYFGQDQIHVRCEQGYEIGRPSLLILKAEKSKTGIEVYVGGRCIEVARGELL